jgi:hypothetical protein
VYGLVAGQPLTVTVRACNARGCGPTSTKSLDANGVTTRPGAPTGLTVTTSASSGSGRPDMVRLAWAPPSDQGGGVLQYEFSLTGWGRRGESIQGVEDAATTTVTRPLSATADVSSPVDLTLSVRARSSVGWGPWTQVPYTARWDAPPPVETPAPENPAPGGTSP